jgi:hypothetical protein
VNATSHGLTARTLVLSNEDTDDFLEMLRAYFDLLLPANAMEVDLVSDIVAARWRLRRMWRYQTAIIDVEMATQSPEFEKRWEIFDEDMRGATAFSSIELRRLRGGNILPETPRLQIEPTSPNLATLNTTPDTSEISTEPKDARP